MFLSQQQLNYETQKSVFLNLEDQHRFVYAAFGANQTHQPRTNADSAGVLYRLEATGQMLVQSTVVPVVPGWTVKEFQPQIVNGAIFRFRLKANPTKRESGGGRRVAVLAENRIEWLERKALLHGFDLILANVTAARRYDVGVIGVIQTVTYEGILRVFDNEQFAKTLIAGIGSGKAWGCGLLSLAKA